MSVKILEVLVTDYEVKKVISVITFPSDSLVGRG